MKRSEIFIMSMILSLALMACGQKTKAPPEAPPGYDWSVFEKILLSDGLLEVSGIAFAPGHFDTLYAQQDEESAIFKVGLPSGKYIRVDFGDTGDYEDIAIQSDTLLLMRSDGSFYGFKPGSLQGDKATPFASYEKILPKGEYEGLFADSATHSYYALCKSCKEDKKGEQTSLYQLQFRGNSLLVVGQHRIVTTPVLEYADKKKTVFEPSALARHPLTGELYIISSVNKMLVVVNKQWEITAIYPLGRKHLMQPEGIAFDGAGNMYISSEGDELQAGRILKFAYKKVQ